MRFKVISGGQSGMDIAGVRAAKRVGLLTGGSLPRGFRTVEGVHPEYAADFGMVALPESDYRTRTRKNVADADITLIIGYDIKSPGIRTTLHAIRDYQKQSKIIVLPRGFSYREKTHPYRQELSDSDLAAGEAIVADIVAWIIMRQPVVINIAGNREPSLEEPAEALLFDVFTQTQAASESPAIV